MVEVTQTTKAGIDHDLERSLASWSELPQVEAEIDSWHQLEQIDFVEEWAVQEDRLARLERYAASGAMTTEQRARFAELQAVVARNRPIITRLRS